MPYMVDTPVIQRQINYWKITGTKIHTPIEGSPFCEIEVTSAFRDTDGHFSNLETRVNGVHDADFVAEMMSPTTGGTMWDEMAHRLYARCVADGIIPAEAVEV